MSQCATGGGTAPVRKEWSLRPSRMLRTIRAGGVARGFKLNFYDARAVELVAAAGFDAIWICNEHVPSDWLALEHQVRAAKLYDCDTVCRVARGGYSDYVRAFEMDAAAVMVPHIMGLDDARAVVRMTKFLPLGRRPVDGGNADGAYTRVPLTRYLEESNRERLVIVQVEDPEPLSEIEAIAELPGIDMLFFGPGDFSHAIGKPGQFDAPELVAAKRRVAEAARKAGKMAGTVSGPKALRETVDLGYNFVNCGADVVGLIAYADGIMDAFDAAGL